jgi:osmoprotectant transport system ATP-binding protein
MPEASAPGIPAIRFDGVVRAYGDRRAVDGVTLDIPRGAFAVLVGPSGCGKTTLLKTVNRLLEPTGGRVFVDGVDNMSTDAVALRRRIGYAIQQVGLFPHMTVAENVAVVPRLLDWPRERIQARVDELLDLVHLEPASFCERYPRQLSGGQQQRVGLARSLAGDPDVLLMDEPFGAVDAIERAHLQEEIATLQRQLHKTILFVTHDVDEALRLGDVIVVMREGRIEQAGTPFDILAQPASAFVSDLVDAHDVLRRLSVVKVAAATDRHANVAPEAPSTGAASTLREALSAMVAAGERSLRVVENGATVGVITLDGILEAARRMPAGSSR